MDARINVMHAWVRFQIMKTAVKRKPRYTRGQSDEIFQLLRQDVQHIVARHDQKRRWIIQFKAIFFPVLFFGTWAIAMFWGKNPWVHYLCYIALGFEFVLIYLNIVHDAVHHTIFRSRRLNEAFVYMFDLIGANSYIWKLRHVRFHHNYPNVNGWDTDVEQSTIARVFPSASYSRIHKYQHIYLPMIYPLFLFNWLIIRDFKDYFDKKRTVHKLIRIPRIEYIKLILFKSLFFFYMIFLPKMILGISWGQTLGAFLISVLTASIFSLLVLLPPHANTSSDFPLPDEVNQLSDNWFMHMLKTTNDVTHDNWLTRYVMGSFNFHVVHHLFPNVNHAYYPEITKRLEHYALQHDLPYRKYPLFSTLKKHYLLLKQNRFEHDIFEEDM
jgi:linoleoyl-CoA desaturase